MYSVLFLEIQGNPFLIPQASEPSMNFSISKLVFIFSVTEKLKMMHLFNHKVQ